MRPLKLIMTGFGPYKETTEIDFEQLGSGGMYIVTGDTGSGKTFIFDAITFALYGDMSGNNRSSSSSRSLYNDDSVKTEVELLFEYRGDRYLIKRTPDYVRSKKRGEGSTKQSSTAELTFPDKSVLTGPDKVNKAIKDLLGIDRNQFCSIAMIAQGEFRKVLTATTEERQKLFRKLFNTEPYNTLMETLGKKSSAVKNDLENTERDLRAVLMSVDCSFNEDIAAELEDSKLKGFSAASLDDTKDMLERLIEAGGKRKEDVAAEISAAESVIKQQSNKIALAEQNRDNHKKLNERKAAVPELEERAAAADKALKNAESKLPQIEKLEGEAAQLDSLMGSYDELDSEKERLAGLESQYSEKSKSLTDIKERRDKLAEEINSSERELEELRPASEKLERVKASIQKNEGRIKTLDALLEDLARTDELRSKYDRLKDEYLPLEKDAVRLEKIHIDMRSAYMKEQAGVLAAGLVDGEPCPVCGSTHHPDPAVLSADAVSSEDVEEAEETAQAARALSNDKWDDVQKAKGTLTEAETSARTAAAKELGEEDFSKAAVLAKAEKSSLEGSLADMRKEESALAARKDKAADIESALPGKKNDLRELGDSISSLSTEVSGLEKDVTAARTKAETIRSRLVYDSKADAQKDRDGKAAEARSLRDAIRDAGDRRNEAVSARKQNDAGIAELEEIVSGYAPVDEELARKQLEEAESAKKELSSLSVNIASELRTASSALDSMKAGAEEIAKIRRRHEIIDSLARTATGKLIGKEKISLEAYVQAFYFDRIIRHANRRFMMMSGDQYEFVRSELAENKRDKFGLDLDIIDHDTGGTRSVSTLSGGESFMASLSLALGLSDEIQSSSGGIKLDTMFIDEGFGSLDGESLENAVRTLKKLAQENKLVGIISHVETLANRIERKMIVTKDRVNGSHVEIVIDR